MIERGEGGRTASGGSEWHVDLRQGVAAAWPVCLGYLPIGLAFGVLAGQNGLGPLEAGLMSLLVFAGGSQFIAVAMLAAGASLTAIVLTTFVVNLRHALMSSSLAVRLGGAGRRFLALFAYGITDESYALNTARFRDGGWNRRRALAVNQTANAAWIASSVAGAWLGELIPVRAFGIDFALPAMFICLLVLQLRGRSHLITAAVAGLLAVGLYLFLPGNGYIIVASVGAATITFFLGRRADRKDAP